MKALCIAHRGRHTKYYENTVEAFIEGSKLDFYGLETDIHLTKDHKWIIHHDDDIVSNGKHYFIKDLTFDETISLVLDNDQNHKDARCFAFEEYLKICKESGKRPIIELKNSPKKKYIKSLFKYVDSYIGISNVTVIGFYPWPLIKLRHIYKKNIDIQQLVTNKHTKLILKIAKWKKFSLDMDKEYLTPDIISSFHNKGLKVNVWCVDNNEELARFESLNVDYITTNTFTQNS